MMALRGACAAVGLAAVWGLLPGPIRFSSPAGTFPFARLFRGGIGVYQSSVPAIDAAGNVYQAYATVDRCSSAYISGFSVQAQYSTAKLVWSTTVVINDWCVAPAALAWTPVSDPIVSESVAGGAAIVTFPASRNGTSGTSSAIVATSLNGTALWSGLLPAGIQQAVLVANGTQLAAVVALPSGTGEVFIVDVATGKEVTSYSLPAGSPGCGGNLSSVNWVTVGTASDGSDVLWINAFSQQYQQCTMGWAVTGPRAGQVLWGAGTGSGYALAVSPADPAVAFSFMPQPPVVMGVGLNITAVDAGTGVASVKWSVPLPGGESIIAGASAAGPYLFVLASYSVWRGCAAPIPVLYAFNASNGQVLQSIMLTRYPDIGRQPNGALLAVQDPSNPINALLYWRETHGWGSFDSQITAGSFAGSYFLITSRYDGADYGTNIAHDDQGQNAVKGCPPSVDQTPGRTGAMLTGPLPGQLLLSDWSGFQVFQDQSPPPGRREL